MINLTKCVCVCSRERSLGLFEVLARNRQSAVELSAVRRAHENIPPDCVQYLLDNDCPLPDGWSYEDGELYSSEEEEGDYVDWEEVMEYWADPEDWDEFMEHWAHGM